MPRLLPLLRRTLFVLLLLPHGVGRSHGLGAREASPAAAQPVQWTEGEHTISINLPGCNCGGTLTLQGLATLRIKKENRFEVKKGFVILEGRILVSNSGASGTMVFDTLRLTDPEPSEQPFRKSFRVSLRSVGARYKDTHNRWVRVDATKIQDEGNTFYICLPHGAKVDRAPVCGA